MRTDITNSHTIVEDGTPVGLAEYYTTSLTSLSLSNRVIMLVDGDVDCSLRGTVIR